MATGGYICICVRETKSNGVSVTVWGTENEEPHKGTGETGGRL